MASPFASVLDRPEVTDSDEESVHWVCRTHPDRAYCGAELDDVELSDTAEVTCPVCVLEEDMGHGCPKCGEAAIYG